LWRKGCPVLLDAAHYKSGGGVKNNQKKHTPDVTTNTEKGSNVTEEGDKREKQTLCQSDPKKKNLLQRNNSDRGKYGKVTMW